MKLLSRNIFRIGIALVLVVGLVLGLALPGLAAQEDKAINQGKILQSIIRGDVTGKGTSSFNVKTNKGLEIVVMVDGNTKFFLVPGAMKAADVAIQKIEQERIRTQPQTAEGKLAQKPALSNKAAKLNESTGPKAEGKGILKQDDLKWLQRFGKEAGFGDLAIGDKVLVYPVAVVNSTAITVTAKIVLIIKQPVLKQIKGTIEAVGANSITIAGDTTITLSYDKDTVFTLRGIISVQPGQMAHVVYNVEKNLAKRVSINGAEE